jgi:hypothetical protein
VFAAAQAGGASANAAFAAIFIAQLLFGIAIAFPLAAARRSLSASAAGLPSIR